MFVHYLKLVVHILITLRTIKHVVLFMSLLKSIPKVRTVSPYYPQLILWEQNLSVNFQRNQRLCPYTIAMYVYNYERRLRIFFSGFILNTKNYTSQYTSGRTCLSAMTRLVLKTVKSHWRQGEVSRLGKGAPWCFYPVRSLSQFWICGNPTWTDLDNLKWFVKLLSTIRDRVLYGSKYFSEVLSFMTRTLTGAMFPVIVVAIECSVLGWTSVDCRLPL